METNRIEARLGALTAAVQELTRVLSPGQFETFRDAMMARAQAMAGDMTDPAALAVANEALAMLKGLDGGEAPG